MDLNKQKVYVDKIKKCQRNWNHNVLIPAEHIDHLIYLATNTPTKQHEAYFNLYVITNRDLLEELFEHTWGFTYPINNETPTNVVPSCARNPQMNASAYFLWTMKFPKTVRNFERTGKEKISNHSNRRDNAYTSIGISMGVVAFSASSLGYDTGFNKNHTKPGYAGYWSKRLGITLDEEITYGLGIGKGIKNLNWNETNEHELLVGWPQTEKIDINKISTYTYNNQKYDVRKQIVFPAFSLGERDISIKRFD